jgi:hypothetical protein
MIREQFMEQVLRHVHDKFPLVKLARGGMPFSIVINGYPAPLENLYRLVSLRPAEMNRHVERWVVELLRAAEGHPDHSSTFEELRQRILPMVIPEAAGYLQPSTMACQPFVADLLIAYAVDQDRTIDYIPRGRFEQWGISLDQLHETALENLVNRSNAIEAHAAPDEKGEISLIVFQTMDGYDASRILLPTLHDRLRGHLGSPFAAAIPNRDILLCFRGDPDTVDKYRKQIRSDFQQMPHQVTDKLLLVTPDGIAANEP